MLSSPTALRIEEATTEGAVNALVQEWTALWEQCPSATPFQTPEWLLAWWRHLGCGELWVLAVRRGETLIGLAPLFITPAGPAASDYRQKKAALLGAGVTDYLDILCRPDVLFPVTHALYRRLLSERGRWEQCDFQEMRTLSPLLLAPPPPPLFVRIRPLEACPVLSLPRSVEDFREALPPAQRVRLRRARYAVEKSGPAVFECADAQTLPEHLDDLFRLRRACRELRGVRETDVSDEGAESTAAFHRDVAAAMLRRGFLRLFRLRLAGRTAAVLYGFQSKGVFYCSLVSSQPDLARLSPGIVLVQHAIERAIAEGAEEFDFLRGRQKYKYIWGARDRMNYRITVGHAPFAESESPELRAPAAAAGGGPAVSLVQGTP